MQAVFYHHFLLQGLEIRARNTFPHISPDLQPVISWAGNSILIKLLKFNGYLHDNLLETIQELILKIHILKSLKLLHIYYLRVFKHHIM